MSKAEARRGSVGPQRAKPLPIDGCTVVDQSPADTF